MEVENGMLIKPTSITKVIGDCPICGGLVYENEPVKYHHDGTIYHEDCYYNFIEE